MIERRAFCSGQNELHRMQPAFSPDHMNKQALELWVNGTLHRETSAAADTTLLRWLRDFGSSAAPRLRATKEGCAEGDCGACCVLVRDHGQFNAPYTTQHACLRLLPALHGCDIVTLEGVPKLASDPCTGLHPAQRRVLDHHGLQCGYCTPGFVMTLAALEQHPEADAATRLAHLAGNLCRCTGYTGLRAAALAAGHPPHALIPPKVLLAASTSNEPAPVSFCYTNGEQTYARPTSLSELWVQWQTWPNARLVAGATDLAIERNLSHQRFSQLIDLSRVHEARAVTCSDSILSLGASTTLSACEEAFRRYLHLTPALLRYFGSPAIQHVATIGGNLCTSSPIGDLAPLFLVLDATVVLARAGHLRRLPLHEFFTGRRQNALAEREIMVAVEIPVPPPSAQVVTHKVSKRREVDISSVSAAFYLDFSPLQRIAQVRIAYGGMAATPRRAALAEAHLHGQVFDEASLIGAAQTLGHEFSPQSDHRASAWYRLTVAQNLLIDLHRELTA